MYPGNDADVHIHMCTNFEMIPLQACPMYPAEDADVDKHTNSAVDSVARFSKRIPGFGLLDPHDQRTLVRV